MNLIDACKIGNLEQVKKFFNNKESVIRARWQSNNKGFLRKRATIHTAFIWASMNGHIDVVRYLVSLGTYINIEELIQFANDYDHIELVCYLISIQQRSCAEIDEIEDPKIRLTIRCLLEIDKLKKKKIRVKVLLIILKRFILKREAVKCIPYLPKVGIKYFEAKECFARIS